MKAGGRAAAAWCVKVHWVRQSCLRCSYGEAILTPILGFHVPVKTAERLIYLWIDAVKALYIAPLRVDRMWTPVRLLTYASRLINRWIGYVCTRKPRHLSNVVYLCYRSRAEPPSRLTWFKVYGS